MKKCPFCAEEIQDDAAKCKHCGEFLKKEEREKWYFKTSSLIIAFLCVGPLMLPLVWFSPRLSRLKKIIISAIILVLSCFLIMTTIKSLQSISVYYRQIFR
jgi:predicted nucleic acid-binding Zn ribbon protein